jgi:hypothetical protein
MLLPIPLVEIIISLESSIALNSIRLPDWLSPFEEYYHNEFPAESTKLIVLRLLKVENAYNLDSSHPNVKPRWPQLVGLLPVVFLIQEDGSAEVVNGLNLKKC